MHKCSSIKLKGRYVTYSFILIFIFLFYLYYCYIWDLQSPDVKNSLPGAIIIGVKKAGTRALLNFLGLHPQVFVAKSEIHFFNKPWYYYRGYRWYAGQMPRPFLSETTDTVSNSAGLSDSVVMEKTPAYFHMETVAERVYKMNASMKVIMIVREPIARIISDHAQEEEYSVYGGTIEQKLIDRYGKINNKSELLSPSLYAKHLKRWLSYFPREQIHIVDGDKLVRENPSLQMSPLAEFLEINPQYFTLDKFSLNADKGFYCVNKQYAKHGGNGCLGSSKGRPHPQISNKLLKLLQEYFTEVNKEFFQLSGQSFQWNYP